ncbi:MAG: hypothetical protein GX434_12460 [Peptococcaceae bacterium]|nr:hypothetical protein [Peptococcaceae bacterium]
MNIVELEFENIGKPEDQETQNQFNKLKRQLQSSNINMILGAGFSCPVSGLLGNIEERMCEAEARSQKELQELQKEFFVNSMLPLADEAKVAIGETERVEFLSLTGKIISNRQSSILHKIVNVFTTNYDLLLESAFEKGGLEYVDGFSGKILPTFSTANYGMIFSRQTSISSKTSEIVTFNLYKVHGSLNWHCSGEIITNCDHIDKINKLNKKIKSNEFNKLYESELAIINPTKKKLNTTVLDVNYYDQLRMYCNELEKNNTILLSFGFSFNDEHIRQMTLRSLKGNPTLNLIIFSFNSDATKAYESYFQFCENVTIIQLIKKLADEDEDIEILEFTQQRLNDIFREIYDGIK